MTMITVVKNFCRFGELSTKPVSRFNCLVSFLKYEAGRLLKVFGTHAFPSVKFSTYIIFLVGYSKGGWLATQSIPPGSVPARNISGDKIETRFSC